MKEMEVGREGKNENKEVEREREAGIEGWENRKTERNRMREGMGGEENDGETADTIEEKKREWKRGWKFWMW